LFPEDAATPPVFEVPVVAPTAFPLSPPAVGPAIPPAVSDVPAACVEEPELLVFAADADFVPLPLQAVRAVAIAIEKRIERFIFRG
jgi:hypothetical protein